jgi:hypothetical protein
MTKSRMNRDVENPARIDNDNVVLIYVVEKNSIYLNENQKFNLCTTLKTLYYDYIFYKYFDKL